MTPDLEPCPFCWDANAYIQEEGSYEGKPLFVVTCLMCCAKTMGCMSAEQAVSAWNDREPREPWDEDSDSQSAGSWPARVPEDLRKAFELLDSYRDPATAQERWQAVKEWLERHDIGVPDELPTAPELRSNMDQ